MKSTTVKTLFALAAGLLIQAACAGGGGAAPEQAIHEAWLMPAEMRVFREAFTREPGERREKLEALAGEWVSAQVAVRCDQDMLGLYGSVDGLAGEGDKIPADSCLVRYAGYVPVDETMQMTPDPLLEQQSVDVRANLVQPVWLTIHVPRDLPAGTYTGGLTLGDASGWSERFDLELEVLPAVLPEPPGWSFHLNLWQDPTPVARVHGVELWSEQHWELLTRYARNFADHGMKAIMTHITYDPWDSVRGYADDTMVEWNYPGVYEPGTADRFTWDFGPFDRYVQIMTDAGVRRSIDMYAMVMGPGGTLKADIRYMDTEAGVPRWIEMEVGEPEWRHIWKTFLPVLREHLRQKGWFDRAVLGFDEKPENVMRMIFDFIAEEAPEFKVASSGGFPGSERKWADEIVFHIRELLDEDRWAEIRPVVESMHADPDRYVTFYTACRPHYPNTFIFSSLRESRLLPWIAWRYGLDGYIRWAVNLYPEDPWAQPRFTWPSGDMFFVYPGERGPLDSMRWEMLRQGIQDYEALRMAWEKAERAGRDDLLEQLRRAVAIGSRIDSCGWLDMVGEARRIVNSVLRELG